MIDHGTSYPILPHSGDLWTNARSNTVLFIYRSGTHIKGIWSDGKTEDEPTLIHLQHGNDGWRRMYPPVQDAE